MLSTIPVYWYFTTLKTVGLLRSIPTMTRRRVLLQTQTKPQWDFSTMNTSTSLPVSHWNIGCCQYRKSVLFLISYRSLKSSMETTLLLPLSLTCPWAMVACVTQTWIPCPLLIYLRMQAEALNALSDSWIVYTGQLTGRKNLDLCIVLHM